MSESTQALADLLPGKDSVDDYTLHEIEQLTQQYPYFAPAQFLLLKKLKQADPGQYQKALQKARLYYHDPLQLEWILSSDKFQLELNDLPDEANVVTEAMAEVWLKQGNKQKAIETYNKLSLLNPSKKAYFAAQIEHLKQS